MACNCIDDFETQIVERQPFTGIKVQSAKFDKALIFSTNDSKAQIKPVIEVELEVEGRKRPMKRSIIFTYCPFCGVAYEPINNEKPDKEAAQL